MFDLLVLYVNGLLEKDRISEVMSHLSSCGNCRKELSWLLKLKKLARETAVLLTKFRSK
jgi:anti-sigma factor RsiW